MTIDPMDLPEQPVDKNDERFVPAIKLAAVVSIGVKMVNEIWPHVQAHEDGAKEAAELILTDCRELAREAMHIVEDIGDVEASLMMAEVLQGLEMRIEMLEEF
jgi:hypothetical protein